MSAIFGVYDQAALDKEYDNRAKVGKNLGDYLASFAAESLLLRASVSSTVNISYGASGAETLDIFPGEGAANQPVQIFIHGGYWKALDAKDFSFVARAFQPRGVLTIVLNYGLLPAISLADLVDQCTRAVVWVHRNVAGYGGDPGKIFLSGHSAGGHLAAMMLMTDWSSRGLPADLVKGAVGISGLYDLEPVRLSFVNEDLALTPAEVDKFSPVRHSPAGAAPFSLPVGADEGAEFLRQSGEMADAWRAHGINAEALPMEGHNHFSIIQELMRPESALASLICRQMGI